MFLRHDFTILGSSFLSADVDTDLIVDCFISSNHILVGLSLPFYHIFFLLIYQRKNKTINSFCCARSLRIFTAHRNARIPSAVLAIAIPSVRPSVRLSHAGIVKTTACSTVQFALSGSKMYLVL